MLFSKTDSFDCFWKGTSLLSFSCTQVENCSRNGTYLRNRICSFQKIVPWCCLFGFLLLDGRVKIVKFQFWPSFSHVSALIALRNTLNPVIRHFSRPKGNIQMFWRRHKKSWTSISKNLLTIWIELICLSCCLVFENVIKITIRLIGSFHWHTRSYAKLSSVQHQFAEL